MKIETGSEAADERLIALIDSIHEGNADDSLIDLEILLDESLGNIHLAGWITEPANIKQLHDDLVEYLGVHPRTMQLKNRIPHRQRRAVFFIKAMINGVKRVI